MITRQDVRIGALTLAACAPISFVVVILATTPPDGLVYTSPSRYGPPASTSPATAAPPALALAPSAPPAERLPAEQGSADAPDRRAPLRAAESHSDVVVANCSAVRAAGRAPLLRGEPGYRLGLDGDNPPDGIACEGPTTAAVPTTPATAEPPTSTPPSATTAEPEPTTSAVTTTTVPPGGGVTLPGGGTPVPP